MNDILNTETIPDSTLADKLIIVWKLRICIAVRAFDKPEQERQQRQKSNQDRNSVHNF